MSDRPPREPNGLGSTGLVMSTLSLFFVFSIGVCAGAGMKQGWIQVVGTLLFILGASSAFLGVLGAFISFFGLFGRNRRRGAALLGLLFGIGSVALFLAVLKAVQQGS